MEKLRAGVMKKINISNCSHNKYSLLVYQCGNVFFVSDFFTQLELYQNTFSDHYKCSTQSQECPPWPNNHLVEVFKKP